MARRYLLLARDPGDWSEIVGEISQSQVEEILGRYIAWTEDLGREGRLVASERLVDGEGRVVSGRGGEQRILDGPYAESKEVVGGFWIIEADDYAQALELIREHPHLEYGSLELREIAVD